jgi:hypothetical protein
MVGTFFSKALESRPRFSLNASTGVLTRFLGYNYLPWEESCVILHVNLSGVAVALPEPLTPILGEWILLEVPSEVHNESNYFYGKVVHIQDLSNNFQGVVIQFLNQHLSEKFEISRAFSKLLSQNKSDRNAPSTLVMGLSIPKRKFLLSLLALFWIFAVFIISLSLMR